MLMRVYIQQRTDLFTTQFPDDADDEIDGDEIRETGGDEARNEKHRLAGACARLQEDHRNESQRHRAKELRFVHGG